MYPGVTEGAMRSKAVFAMFTDRRASPHLPSLRSRGATGIGALVLAAAVVAGCNEKALTTNAAADAGGHRTSTSLTPEQSAKVLAKVGERTITLGDYVAALEHMDQFDRLRYQSPERRKELLGEMINVELLATEAKVKGYDKDPVAQQELRAILRDAMLQEARKGAPTPAEIPEADVRGYFDAHRADYRDPERRRFSVIVLKDEASANAVLEQAKKGLTASQWGELVRAKSIDPQAKANVPVDLAGDVGMVSPPGDPRGENLRVPEAVRAGGFEIAKVNDVLPRAVTAEGKLYVVRLTQRVEAQDRAFAEAERAIRVKLAQDRLRAKEEELLEKLKKQFPVQVDDAALATVKVDLADAGKADGHR
jgi:DNA-directed RNA polymerase subunit F